MDISLIVATDLNGGIGKDGGMPWGIIRKDLQYFKGKTLYNNVIMGRKTMDSLPNGFLPNRKNIVLTNDNIKNKNVIFVNNTKDALDICDKDKEIFIIGGANVYEQFIDNANKIYLTKIQAEFDCDSYFPKLNDKWEVKYESPINSDSKFNLQFSILEKYDSN